MKSFTDSTIWPKGLELIREIYKLSKNFPREETFGLTSQIRRASTSIVANFAEGFSRATNADKAHKYTIARGECTEVKAFLLIAETLDYADAEEIRPALQLCEENGKMLSGLIKAFEKKF